MEDNQGVLVVALMVTIVLYIPFSYVVRQILSSMLGAKVVFDMSRLDLILREIPMMHFWTYSLKDSGFQKWDQKRGRLQFLITAVENLSLVLYFLVVTVILVLMFAK